MNSLLYYAFNRLQLQRGQDSAHLFVGAYNTVVYITAGFLRPRLVSSVKEESQ